MNLNGKTIILTGAKRIGQVVARSLAQQGANLAVTYRSSKQEADEIVEECQGTGVKVVSFQADLAVETDIERLITEVKTEFGQIDGLVHMAANFPRNRFTEIKPENIDTEFQIITKSAFMLGKLLSQQMDTGKIIFFSDWAANRAPYKDYAPYLVAKGAIDTLTKVLAVELAPNITVNAIAPGPILMPPDLTKEENEEVLARTPLKKWGGAEEIAKAVLFFLDSDFITGVILPVDGGRTIG